MTSNIAARLLAIMGSGETTPTMVEDPSPTVPATGAGHRSGRPARYALRVPDQRSGHFRSRRFLFPGKRAATNRGCVPRAGRTRGSVSFETALARVSEARWVFAGPGSPTYALRQWRPTVLPRLLSDKLLYGGCLVFSSAAALTLGRWTVPVYETYKVGADPVWADGLDLLTPLGLTVAVIPHFDNAEGGTHDTRYCYLGEERLQVMEAQMPPDGWVLGVDEHTACIFDFDAGTVPCRGSGW